MRKETIFYLIALTTALFDQLVKSLVLRFVAPVVSIAVIPRFFYLTYVKNRGAAFGIFPGHNVSLIIIGIIISVVVLYLHYRLSHGSRVLDSSLALILGGSIGNLLDRVFRGSVVDFIDFRFWPAFNIADAAVNIGIALIIIVLIFGKEKI